MVQFLFFIEVTNSNPASIDFNVMGCLLTPRDGLLFVMSGFEVVFLPEIGDRYSCISVSNEA
jgi:hypothetical protein